MAKLPDIQVVLVGGNDKVLGLKEKYAAHKNPVPLHRAISVVIFDKKGRMLIQKRVETKPTWPGFWSNAVCTHPLPGESYQAAAERRLKEEMGFSTTLKEIFRLIYNVKYDQTWGEHEYDVVFTGKYDGEVNPAPEEIEDFKWIKVDGLRKDLDKNPNKYTPWFKLIMDKI